MNEHPVFGAVLFAIGVVWIGFAYYGPFDDADDRHMILSVLIGHIFVFNGVFFVFLACRKLERERARKKASR